MMIFFGKKDIKVRVENFIKSEAHLFKNKKVVDLPAGSGETTILLHSVGAHVQPYDLFPEFFKKKI